mgnify:CR=1 FL=1
MSDEQKAAEIVGEQWTSISFALELFVDETDEYFDSTTGDFDTDNVSEHRVEADRALRNAAQFALIEQARQLRRIADALVAMNLRQEDERGMRRGGVG